jgi:hypothetical protein
MLIFSYLWTYEQATKRIKEMNSKSKEIVQSSFNELYSDFFMQLEFSKPAPSFDVDFDDFADLNFI